MATDPRLGPMSAVLSRMAKIDEHVTTAQHVELVGEAIRALAPLPAIALDVRTSDCPRVADLRSCLEYSGAVSLRTVLSARNLSAPTAAEALDLVDKSGMSASMDERVAKDPLWGRVANVMFRSSENAHVTHNVEADCLGSLGLLAALLEFLAALDAGRVS